MRRLLRELCNTKHFGECTQRLPFRPTVMNAIFNRHKGRVLIILPFPGFRSQLELTTILHMIISAPLRAESGRYSIAKYRLFNIQNLDIQNLDNTFQPLVTDGHVVALGP